jgi:hypothetical protein
MPISRAVPDDISIFVIDCGNFIDDVSLEGMSNTCFISYDICCDDASRASVSYGISAAATNLERYMSSSMRIHYTEMIGISQRWSESS